MFVCLCLFGYLFTWLCICALVYLSDCVLESSSPFLLEWSSNSLPVYLSTYLHVWCLLCRFLLIYLIDYLYLLCTHPPIWFTSCPLDCRLTCLIFLFVWLQSCLTICLLIWLSLCMFTCLIVSHSFISLPIFYLSACLLLVCLSFICLPVFY